ncbi:MAG: AEC family transporter [Chloroflexi bacterium]|nr:AEC family transporter [Chloroflexota bacterium]
MLWTSFAKIVIPYASLVLIIAVGVFAAWQRILTTERINALSEFVTVLILPIFMFWNAASGSISSVLSQAPWMVGLGFGVGLAGFILTSLYVRIRNLEWPKHSVTILSGSTGNTGFLGIPICTAIFGSHGTILALLFDLGATFYFFTLGISPFQRTDDLKLTGLSRLRLMLKQLVSPTLIALLLGLGLDLLGWQLPDYIRLPVSSLAAIAIPVMMLILGGVIFDTAKNHCIDKIGVVVIGLIKLVILPGLMWLLVTFLPLTATARGVVVLGSAMPSAIMGVTFAARYGADENLASSATMLTTLISLLTIPLIAAIWR